eukprot:3055100-Rhodomonas_salina.3
MQAPAQFVPGMRHVGMEREAGAEPVGEEAVQLPRCLALRLQIHLRQARSMSGRCASPAYRGRERDGPRQRRT